MMVRQQQADGMVAGAINSTANTLRPALQILKTAPGTKLVSSFMIMAVPDCEFGANGTFLFADCGLCENPNAEELSEIAVASAATFRKMTGIEPMWRCFLIRLMAVLKRPDRQSCRSNQAGQSQGS
jgi:phosphate acetyltransferase